MVLRGLWIISTSFAKHSVFFQSSSVHCHKDMHTHNQKTQTKKNPKPHKQKKSHKKNTTTNNNNKKIQQQKTNQKREDWERTLTKNAMSLKRTDTFSMVCWGSKAYIITLCKHVSAGSSPSWTASIQFDTELEISKISTSLKFNGNWNLPSKLITCQSLGNLYKRNVKWP